MNDIVISSRVIFEKYTHLSDANGWFYELSKKKKTIVENETVAE